MMNLDNNEKSEIVDITKETESLLLNDGCNITGDKKRWTKNCPKCGKIQRYQYKYQLKLSTNKNSLCRSCNAIRNKIIFEDATDGYKRSCPKCGKVCVYAQYSGLFRAIKENRWCKSCKMASSDVRRKIGEKSKGRKHSEKTKLEFSNSRKGNKYSLGFKHTKETKKKWSEMRKGITHKPHSEETKYKMRLALINNLKNKNIKFGYKGANNYNHQSCIFIDNLNKEKGWKLQHALNGGEIEIYGYFVDGYDKEKNIIFEYDEKHHFNFDGNLKQKDIQRQQNIIDNLHPNEFWRYNEINKTLNVVYKKD